MKLSRGYMNSDPREKTIHLAEKLIRIRTALGLSQTELLRHLDLTPYYYHTRISLWETVRRLTDCRSVVDSVNS
jgi:hypothetical protein